MARTLKSALYETFAVYKKANRQESGEIRGPAEKVQSFDYPRSDA